jgi:hypothetical protein
MRCSGTVRTRAAAVVVALTVGVSGLATARSAAAVCVGDCDGTGHVVLNSLVKMVNIALDQMPVSACDAGDADHDGKIVVNEIVTAVNNFLGSCPIEPTATATPSATETPTSTETATTTPTPTETATFGPLGTRHFELSKAKSPWQVVLGPGFKLTLGGFQGQTNGVVGPAFLDLEAGQPDPNTGLAVINITNASEYIFADANGLAPIVLCIKPVLLPVMRAGVVKCDGGLDYSTVITQDHHLGQVGINGFTPGQCTLMNGTIEGPNEICSAGVVGLQCRAKADCDTAPGAGDGVCGLEVAFCTAGTGGPGGGPVCQSDADCDTDSTSMDGVCGRPGAHPGVCNGQLEVTQLGGDTGPGEMILGPASEFNLTGIPIELSIETAAPCGDEGQGQQIVFALTSGRARGIIDDFSNNFDPPQTVMLDLTGQNFSCAHWTDPAAPGRLVLVAPALDTNPMGGDVISGFTFGGPGS